MRIQLKPASVRPARTQSASIAPALPGQSQARPTTKRSLAPPHIPARVQTQAALVQPPLPDPSPPRPQQGYPVSHPTRVRPQASAPASSDGLGEIPLDPPVMIKGPMRIPIPAFLRNRDGHFLMSLRCRVEKDGSTRVEVMDSSGAPPLDEAVRESFSGLPWYRAEVAGQPIAVTVRLTVEAAWETGQDSIDWGGRIPPME